MLKCVDWVPQFSVFTGGRGLYLVSSAGPAVRE